MNPFDWIGFGDVDDLFVNIAIVAIVVLTGLLIWQIRSDRAKRRKSKRKNDFDRFQDQ